MFDLPEGTIPDQVSLVTNLPFRNLQRSDSVRLCAGEDAADGYATAYQGIARVVPEDIEPDETYRSPFMLESDESRTPLWTTSCGRRRSLGSGPDRIADT